MGEFCVWLAKMEIEENYFPLQIRKCGLGVEAIARVVTKKRSVLLLCVGPFIYRKHNRNDDCDSGIEFAKVGRFTNLSNS